MVKSQKILTYEPMPKQKALHVSTAPCRAIFGGNRSGKTTSGGMEFLYHMTGVYPEWYPQDMRFSGAIKGRIIARDFQKGVGEVINPFLEEWLDMSLVAKRVKNPMGIVVKWVLKNGSQFDILTHEQDVEQFEGWKGHIAWFDEPPPRDRYIATLRGLVDFSGRHWLTLTPLTQPWIYDDIYLKHDNEKIFVVTVNIRDNEHLSEEAIKDFEGSLTEEEKEARIHGKFMHLSGLVYKEFNPTIHIIEPPEVKKSWTRIMAIDPHDRKATAVVWLAVDPQGNEYVYDELKLKDMDIEHMALAIKAQEGDKPAHVRLIDPHMDKENTLAGGFNVRKEFMKHGIFCERGTADVLLGKSRIRKSLKPEYSTMLRKTIPKLHISKYCVNTIYEFQHYVWDEFKRNKEEQGQKDQVKKVNDDFMDALRYIYNYGPRYIEQETGEQEEYSYAGTYAKYPVKMPAKGSYHSLVEDR